MNFGMVGDVTDVITNANIVSIGSGVSEPQHVGAVLKKRKLTEQKQTAQEKMAVINTDRTRHRASTSTRYHFASGLCCHSNETRTPIANPPNIVHN